MAASPLPVWSEEVLSQVLDLIRSNNVERLESLLAHHGESGVKSAKTTMAHTLFIHHHWAEINRLLPVPQMNFLHASGWLASIAEQKPIDGSGNPIPWITYPAIEFLEGIRQSSWCVFEWGAGNSSLWWAKHVLEVVSVEDNAEWIQMISANTPANSKLLYRPEKSAYINAIKEFPKQYFDVVVIDGSHRQELVESALYGLKPGGFIIFDNVDMPEYADAIAHLQTYVPCRLDFWGLIPSYLYKNCTSIFLTDTSLLTNLPPPCKHRSQLGPSATQAMRV